MKLADLHELRHNAIDEDREPAYVIDFNGERWWVVREPFVLDEDI